MTNNNPALCLVHPADIAIVPNFRPIQHSSIMLDIFVHIHQLFSGKSEPNMRHNSVLMMLAFARLAHCPSLVAMQSVILGFLGGMVKISARNDNPHIYDYFQGEGYSSSIANSQQLSFHYPWHCMILILMLAYLQPKKMPKNKEFNMTSPANKLQQELFQNGLSGQWLYFIVTTFGFLALRKDF